MIKMIENYSINGLVMLCIVVGVICLVPSLIKYDKKKGLFENFLPSIISIGMGIIIDILFSIGA